MILGDRRGCLIWTGDWRLELVDVATVLTGQPPAGDSEPPQAPKDPFSLLDLLLLEGHAVRCGLDLKLPPPETHRGFAELACISLASGDLARYYSLAQPFADIFRRAVLVTSDNRLLPT